MYSNYPLEYPSYYNTTHAQLMADPEPEFDAIPSGVPRHWIKDEFANFPEESDVPEYADLSDIEKFMKPKARKAKSKKAKRRVRKAKKNKKVTKKTKKTVRKNVRKAVKKVVRKARKSAKKAKAHRKPKKVGKKYKRVCLCRARSGRFTKCKKVARK